MKADRDCKTQIFLGNSPGYHLINLIYLNGCVILPMSLQGLFGCRNFMVSMENAWQATLCFAHVCFPNLGFHFYFTQSPNANSFSGLTLFKLTSNKPLLHLQLAPFVVSVTIHGDYGSLWYLSLLVPLTNLVSMYFQWQMLWHLVFFIKNLLCLVLGLNKPFSVNFWV